VIGKSDFVRDREEARNPDALRDFAGAASELAAARCYDGRSRSCDTASPPRVGFLDEQRLHMPDRSTAGRDRSESRPRPWSGTARS